MSSERPIVYIGLAHVEFLAHAIAQILLNIDTEPIPPFKTVKKDLLLSALARPQSTFGGCELYPTIPSKGAALLYSMVKNHPFENGNKRIGTSALLVFLYSNGYWFDLAKLGNKEVAAKVLEVANSEASKSELVVQQFTDWLSEKIIEIKPESLDFGKRVLRFFRR